MGDHPYSLRPIGWVRSPLTDPTTAPRQADEGAPHAWLDMAADLAPALANVRPGDALVVVTWLHLASRDVLTVHPRGDVERPQAGVFSTRSPHRPNPIGLHEVTVLAIEGVSLQVRGLEAVDGTPVVDLKPVLGALEHR